MTVRAAFAVVLASTLLFAGVGAGVGYGLGTLTPGYYRGVFRATREPGFDPVEVGFGQGLTQGIAGGVVTGLALVTLFSWRDIRLRSVSDATPQLAELPTAARRVLVVAGSLLALTFFACCGVGIGLLLGEQNVYHRRYLEERDAINPAVTGDQAFRGVEVCRRSDGGVSLVGEVATGDDLGRLGELVARRVGEERAKIVMMGVNVRR